MSDFIKKPKITENRFLKEKTGFIFLAKKPVLTEPVLTGCKHYLSKPTTCTSFQSGTLEFSNGVRCDFSQYHQRCEVHKSCGECLSSYPDVQDEQEVPLCVWCAGCSSRRGGRCVPRGTYVGSLSCPQSCSGDGAEVQTANQCPEMKCAASDCQNCQQLSITGKIHVRSHYP